MSVDDRVDRPLRGSPAARRPRAPRSPRGTSRGRRSRGRQPRAPRRAPATSRASARARRSSTGSPCSANSSSSRGIPTRAPNSPWDTLTGGSPRRIASEMKSASTVSATVSRGSSIRPSVEPRMSGRGYRSTDADRHLERELPEGAPRRGREVAQARRARRAPDAGDQGRGRRRAGDAVPDGRLHDRPPRRGPLERRGDRQQGTHHGRDHELRRRSRPGLERRREQRRARTTSTRSTKPAW